MKIVLQSKQTLQYFQRLGAWTRDDSLAHNFLHTQKAIDFAHAHGIRDVYVTVKFLGGDPDVVAPVPDKPLQAASRPKAN